MAEETGFEPAVRFDPYERFPSVSFRPLRHPSRLFLHIELMIVIIHNYNKKSIYCLLQKKPF